MRNAVGVVPPANAVPTLACPLDCPPARAANNTVLLRLSVVSPVLLLVLVAIVTVRLSPGVTEIELMYDNVPPSPPFPGVPIPSPAAPFLPRPTATAQIDVTPTGTVKVPDDENSCCPGAATELRIRVSSCASITPPPCNATSM